MNHKSMAISKATAILMLSASLTPLHAETVTSWATLVSSSYKLNFTGFGEVGKINFQTSLNGAEYSTVGSSEIKIPLIYTWSSKINGSGKLIGETPKPSAYLFSSQGKAIIGSTKHHSTRLGFHDNSIQHVTILPPHTPGGSKYVPLRPEHMKEGLDPITAVMMLTRLNNSDPCNRNIPIFDGKHRFDLQMSSAGQQKVVEARPSGQPVIGFVCKVKYVPIAGHKNNDETKHASEKTEIEVLLRPVPSANLLVPYRVTVATKYGTGTMTLQKMDIVAPGQKQIALVH